jgi:PIN domain nuclease of toxin-antitoxin system
MQNLLDTHTFIWFINGDNDLSTSARRSIEDNAAINFVSIASIWEMAIKISLGKLEINGKFEKINEQIEANGFQVLPITIHDAVALATLPFHHRDPFDRILIAQCMTNKLTFISKDKSLTHYPIDLLW